MELLNQGLQWEQVAAITRGREPVDEPFLVWPENWQVACVFEALATQWRVSVGMAGAMFTGLDYAAWKAIHASISDAPAGDVLAWLQLMEAAALPILNAPRERD